MILTVQQGRWVRLRDGTVALVRRVWDDGTCDLGVRGQSGREDVPLSELVCYVEQRTVWVDVPDERPTPPAPTDDT